MQNELAYCLREPSGGGSQPNICYPINTMGAAFMGGQGAKAGGIGYCDDGTTPTLKASPSGGNTVPDVCYALQGNGIDRADTAGCNGRGFRTDEMYTLNTVDRPAVCYPATARALTARYDSRQAKNNGGYSLNYMNPVVYAQQRIGQYVQDIIGSTEMARDYKSAKDLIVESAEPPRKYIVRRLTPTECARLQGFPDWWHEGLGGSDSAIYKAYGNGLALPCAFDVLSRIVELEQEKLGNNTKS